MNSKTFAAAILSLASIFISELGASNSSASEESILHVSKMQSPPTIDGIIDEAEWADACAMSGFRSYATGSAFPDCLKIIWYIGYDDKNLYMAMHSVFPETIGLKADTKPVDQDNEYSLIFDDHIEVQVSPSGRDRAVRQGFGFYKICANPRAVMSDTWYFNGTAGSEKLWSSGADVKCTHTKNSWSLEMSWPLISMKIEKADDQELIMHLVRAGSCSGWYFASIGEGHWQKWNEFYRMILDPNAPALQFLQHGNIVEGQLDTQIRVGGKNGGKVNVELQIDDAKKKVIFKEDKTVEAAPGKSADIFFKADNLPLSQPSDGLNTYYLNVTDSKGLLYNVFLPVALHTPEYLEKNLKPYLSTRPKEGDYKYQIAYIPSFKLVRCKLDMDVFGGVPAKVADAKKFSIEVTAKEGGNSLGKKEFPIENQIGAGKLDVGELPEGDYTCTLRILDGKGKELDAKSNSFKRKHYPWEGNKLGLDRVVIPPFLPLQSSGTSVKATRGEFVFGKGGLFDSMKVDGKELLAGPMRMEASSAGKTSPWQGGETTLEKGKGRTFPADFAQYAWKKQCPVLKIGDLAETDGYDLRVKSQSEDGNVAIKVDGSMDYDGFYNVQLTYGPKNGMAEVDGLDVVIPLGSFADVMVAGRDFGDQSWAGKLPDGEGIIWESKSIVYKPNGFKGTWLPYFYVGNGGRGLWYVAESDEGWMLDDEKSCIQLERSNGQTLLRLRIVNKHAELKSQRTVNFSLLAYPNQSIPENGRKMVWDGDGGYSLAGDRKVLWFNTGWRRYGWGGNDFYMPSDNDYVEFGDFLHYPERFEVLSTRGPGPKWTLEFVKGMKKTLGEKGVLEDMPVVLYSSHLSFSPSLPEFETFSGEWSGTNELKLGVDYGGGGDLGELVDMMGRYIGDTPEKFGEIWPRWTQSVIDCYVWYYEKIFRLARVNGTFYDNAGLVWYCDPDIGLGYVREDGQQQAISNVYIRRQLTKRLNTICWLLGRPPLFYPNATTFDLSFLQKMILIEGEAYIWTADGTLFDSFQPETFRAKFVSKAPALHIVTAHEVRPRDTYAGTSHRPVRSVIALALLFDIGCSRIMDAETGTKLISLIDKEIGLFDDRHQAEFAPYWENSEFIGFASEKNTGGFEKSDVPGVYVSLYRQADKTLVWLVNSTDSGGKAPDIWIDDQKLLGKTATSLRDIETGEKMARLKANDKDPMQKNIWLHVNVPPQTFRALILE